MLFENLSKQCMKENTFFLKKKLDHAAYLKMYLKKMWKKLLFNLSGSGSYYNIYPNKVWKKTFWIKVDFIFISKFNWRNYKMIYFLL